jgi:xanthine dehydrogenase accessory factor
MARPEFLQRLAALVREGASFAVATVVARKAPLSAHLGDAAVVFEDGRIEGHIGGGCSREILRAQAMLALRTGEPRLVRISPDSLAAPPGYPETNGEPETYVRVRMTCASQGALDLYVEPYPLVPILVVAGATPIARATATLAGFLGFETLLVRDPSEVDATSASEPAVIAPDALPAALAALPEQRRGPRLIGVVASGGEYDDVALDALLAASAGYVALVASPQRAAAVMAALRARGRSAKELAAIRNPAGLDIGAKNPPEVALSIMAEIVGCRRSKKSQPEHALAQAIDPICGMTVAIAGAKHSARRGDETYYFCSVGCKHAFAAAAGADVGARKE